MDDSGNKKSAFVGSGWAFPPTFFLAGDEGRAELCAGEEEIRQSLQILLATEPGQRAMRPDFGCDLSRFQFREMDGGLLNEMEVAVTDTLRRLEPRVVVEQVRVRLVEPGAGELEVGVHYRIRATNNRRSHVFPFYINEATSPVGR